MNTTFHDFNLQTVTNDRTCSILCCFYRIVSNLNCISLHIFFRIYQTQSCSQTTEVSLHRIIFKMLCKCIILKHFSKNTEKETYNLSGFGSSRLKVCIFSAKNLLHHS